MTVKKSVHATPRKQASDLLRQRAALVKSKDRRSELTDRVKVYEKRYGIQSRSIHAAINRGQLKEDQEVCRWIIDYELLQRTKAS